MPSNKDFRRWLRVMQDNSETFETVIGKNSQFINIEGGQKIDFVDGKLNPSIFHIVRKLKAEVEGWLMFNERFHDTRERAHIKYFNYSVNLPDKLKEFYYVDISAAYITALYNEKIISEYLFNLIKDLPKKDRLICLGMLAYEPYVTSYVDGEKISEPVKKRNYYSPVFYTACFFIEQLMTGIVELLKTKRTYFYRSNTEDKDNYLFYWVDGIFFQDEGSIKIVSDFLADKGYSFKSGKCYDWEMKELINCFELNFRQEEKGKINSKIYNIPYYFQNVRDNSENIILLKNGDFDGLFANFRKQKYGEIK